MNTQLVLKKLTDAERALQRGDCLAAYSLLREAEESVLQLRHELISLRNTDYVSRDPERR